MGQAKPKKAFSGVGRSYSSNVGHEKCGVEADQSREVGRGYIMRACAPY